MNFKKITGILSFCLLAIFSFTSCEKEAGEGGTSTIKGKVIIYNFDPQFQGIPDTLPARDENVYIIYGGDHATYDDDYKTTYDGSFEFKYLQKGKYKLFAYSKDSTGAYNGTVNSQYRPKVPVFVEVDITDKNQTVIAPDIIILKTN